MLSIGQVQHPKPGVDFAGNGIAARGAVQTATPKLRLAERAEIAVSLIVFEDVECGSADPERFSETLRFDKVQVVCRSMVLGKTPPYTSHQATHGQVEARRTVLTFVVTVR